MEKEEMAVGQKMFEAYMRVIISNGSRKFLKNKKIEQIRREEMLNIDDIAEVVGGPEFIPFSHKYGRCISIGKGICIMIEDDIYGNAFERLNAEYKMIIALRMYLGLGYDEIAEKLGGNPEAHRKRYSRALKKLGELLLEEGYEG